jgi:hypothetical protein
LEVSPSKRQVNIALSNQSALSGVIMVLFWYCSGYIIVSLPFLANYLCFAYYFISGILQVVSKHLPQKNCGLIFFFQGRDVFWHLKATKICRYAHKPMVGDSYMQEIQVVLKRTSFGHPCNPCWYPFEW